MADQQTRHRGQEASVEDAIAALTERFDKFARHFEDNARSAARSVSDTVDEGREKASEITGDAYDDVSRRGRHGVRNVGDSISRHWEDDARGIVRSVSDTVEEGSHQVREAVRDGYRDMRRQGQRGVESVSGRIEEKPITSVLIALGVGFLIGKMM